MGLFDDKKYESMDEISKMVEPWENPFDSIIEKLPDEYEVSPRSIFKNLEAYEVEDKLIKDLCRICLTPEELNTIVDSKLIEKEYKNNKYMPGLFDVKISDDFSFNSVSQEVTGSIKLIKTMKMVSEAKLKEKILKILESELFKQRTADAYKAENMRTIFEVVTGKPYQSEGRSKKNLIFEVKKEIILLITEDRWRIRSFKLYCSLIHWFEYFMSTGSSASIANIMKLKIMTYNGRAIYSIGEEK